MHELEAEYWTRVDFVYIDREDPANKQVVDLFGVTYQPVLVFLSEDGTELQRWFYYNGAELRAAFDEYLSANS